jgi:hypothetical protein
MKERVMWIAWPAFLTAGVLETVVFALVDPEALRGFDGEPLELSRSAVYTLSFFVFWGATMLSSALTTLLSSSPFERDRCPLPVDGRPEACPKPVVR